MTDSSENVVDHFVSPLEGDATATAGPDDQLRLAYAPTPGPQTLTGASSAFNMVMRFGDDQVKFFRFRDPDSGKAAYYDAKGEKLGQYLLRNPVPKGRATSGFGMRRHPVLGYTRMHSGQDWAAPAGSPIYAAADGVVTFVGTNSGDGKMTTIDHGHGYETSYAHQSKFAKGIKSGVKVEQGQLIGYVGHTGLTTGSHLHYEVAINGRKVDPMSVHFIVEDRLTGAALTRFQKAVKAERLKS
ncbi:M23 family metallopeptidase [Martelella endophytica]|uniref:M23ase beta-sheet core domain-containing protein n=1 Tax=Martelella endophytica TaxID=1486262 RepID=A0A0D5LT32_MAREN|nr:M23 family metallopeptidase [Martelella endophytica]AJY47256.1 hypothetical protein TM49_18780 [Martelella endophytica]